MCPACPVCSRSVARRGRRGPDPAYCSPGCQTEARNERRRSKRHEQTAAWWANLRLGADWAAVTLTKMMPNDD